MNFEERYKKLNDEQREAVDTLDGAVMVNAGPGSGKTELLAMRTANLLKTLQINPGNILLLTFTENAAFNMRERLQKLIGSAAYGVAIYTFHGFANDVISRYGEYFFDGANFRPVTDVEKINIIEKILHELSKKSKLGKKEFEGGYIFTNDILSCISGLKKGNLNADDFRESVKDNYKVWQKINAETKILEKASGGRKFDLVFGTYVEFYATLKSLSVKKQNEYLYYLLNTLDLEIIKSKDSGEYKNLNEWRDEFFTKDEEGDNFKILKDSRKEKIEKWLELADVFEKFDLEMKKEGLYDFDDMIYLVAKELKDNTSLRNELEEKFQYIMVDEFQDTNESQFSLIQNLTSSDIHNGNPNILVVGDDDQAIYKFQGAELSNIYKFLQHYPQTKKIVLNKNYRSTQNVLDFARSSILLGKDRLEMRDKSFRKDLVSGREIKAGNIIENKFENVELEYDYISNEIQNILSSGVAPEEISIISNKHQTLKDVANYLNLKKIPYSYEKKEHVLDKQHIKELITILEFVNSVTAEQVKDYLLPDILSFKFWNLSRIDIWKIAESVREVNEDGKRKSWFNEILNNENSQIKKIGEFLLELSIDAKNIPLEHLLDKIIGTTEWEFEGEYADLEITNNNLGNTETNFVSPYKNYYFGKDNFLHNKPEYLDFLFSLRTFVGALREFKQGQILKATDIDEFLSVYKNNDKLSLTSVSPFASSAKSIVLQTAYKAKGLEYEYVYIVNANEKDWNGRGVTNKIGFPKNTKLLSESDDYDDKLRLFYVALTRAKHTLYITYSNERLGFIGGGKVMGESKLDKNITPKILQNLHLSKKQDYVQDEKVLLKRLLENYQMPVTHLTNFLNLGKVGPDKFVEQNLLRFPQAMSESAIYGSAMHYAIQNYYSYFKKHEKLASIEQLDKYFESALIKFKMPENLFNKNLIEGKKNLKIYFEDLKKRGGINTTDVIEFRFKNEGVKFGDVHAAGNIDKISINPKDKGEILVTDFKTGKSFTTWEAKDSEYTKIKLHFYQYQLVYYKLLIKNSRTYKNYNVNMGQIEFIEADDDGKINVLELELTDELVARVEKLANIIYNKILNLDFPDVTKYTHTEVGKEKEEIKLTDILNFEEDLLSG
jgi:DNA helicase-2/ATP-dependent DNA helicase PcrA